jgi:S-adenosyl-L-methionine hydrolase (adenosine-forming)
MPIITLLTDFGSQDYFVGAMKGVILSLSSAAQIIDLTHEVPPQDVPAAAFNLLAVYKDFPPGTIHLAVVDPGVGSSRRAIVIECGGQFFVGPDNGIFSWICEREDLFRVFQVTNERFFRQPLSNTFHGRDVFAPVAAALADGISSEDFGPEVEDPVLLESLQPRAAGDGSYLARIIHIDRFGNCITNLTRDHMLMETRSKLLINGREITSFRKFFADQPQTDDELFCLEGSAGFLEIAARNASAAKILKAERDDEVRLISA